MINPARHTLFALLAMLLMPPAMAAEKSLGLWQGEIGKLPAVACFNDDGKGFYYYPRNAKLLILSPAGKQRWQEEALGKAKLTGQWTLQPPAGDTMTGEWNTANGKNPTPIHLSRLALQDKRNADSPCEDAAFNTARLASAPRKYGKPFKLDALQLREVSVFGVKGLELIETTPSALGKTLSAHIDAALGEYFRCEASIAVQNPERSADFDFAHQEELQQVTPNYLVLHWNSNTYCGGDVHANYHQGAITLLRKNGNAILPSSWFLPPNNQDGIPKTSSLASLINQQYRAQNTVEDEDAKQCREVVAGTSDWTIWPSRQGMLFEPNLPHAVFACSAELLLPWAKLAPYLNDTGRKLMAEMSALRP